MTIAGAQTPPPGVNVKLSFAENKTVYRIGEPIKLVMEFTADREGYIVEILTDGNEPGSDTVVVSPEIGVTRWYEEFRDNYGYGRHVFSTEKLTATPKRLEITVNDRLRFDSPGRYSVSVTTRRIAQGSQQALITTNSLNFEIVSMSESDEAKEVKRLIALLDAKRDPQDQEIGKRFSYLTGDPSTREKVRRLLGPELHARNMHTWNGLLIARNRALVLKLLEAGLRDSNVPVTLPLLTLVTRLKTFLVHGPKETSVNPAPGLLERWESPQAREIRDAYVAEVAAGLAKRTGDNQTTTAFTVLTGASADSKTTSPAVREARQILIQHFDSLDRSTQELLLRSHWEVMRDSALVPSLKKMLASLDTKAQNAQENALKCLMDMAPDEARPLVIREIRDPSSRVEPTILGALEDKSLPEVDAALLDQVRRASTQKANRIYLKFKVDLLVRFATDSIYQELMELYRDVGEKLPADSRGALLAYFAKHNEREAIPMIEKVVSEFKPGADPMILGYLTRHYYSDEIGVILKKLLESDDYSHASHAAYLIGRQGTAGDERVLESRLKRWREEWRDRVAEADAQNQGQIERELIWALINGQSWKFSLSPERVQELRMSCITNVCKQSNLVQR